MSHKLSFLQCKSITWKLVILITAVVLLFALNGCSEKHATTEPKWKNSIDLSSFISITCDGYEGYGTVETTLDVSRIVMQYKLSEPDTKRLINILGKNGENAIKIKFDENIKNGDIVEIEWILNENEIQVVQDLLCVNVICNNMKYSVNELQPLVKYDPFENLQHQFVLNENGVAELQYSISGSIGGYQFTWPVRVEHNNDELKNGDIVTLVIDRKLNMEKMARELGVEIARTERDYQVRELVDWVCGDEIFEHISMENIECLNDALDGWVGSGINDDTAPMSFTFELLQLVYYTSGNPQGDGALLAVYSVREDSLGWSYYTFVGLTGVFSYTAGGLTVDYGKPFPELYTSYERELVRYNENYGWMTGTEKMGFIYNGVAYAGHISLSEIIPLLDSVYGKELTYRYIKDVETGEISEAKMEGAYESFK